MKQKKLVLTVYSPGGEVQFSKDPASPQDVMSALTLFDEIGNEITLAIREFEISVSNES